jgi:hypothetical protein
MQGESKHLSGSLFRIGSGNKFKGCLLFIKKISLFQVCLSGIGNSNVCETTRIICTNSIKVLRDTKHRRPISKC